MRCLFALLAISIICPRTFGGEATTLTDAEKAAGWKLLFDGNTTAGWLSIAGKTFPDKGWSVREGMLHHAKGGGGGDIITSESYEDFELIWEWKIAEGGNSGLKYNMPDPSKAVGFEYQLIDDAKHPDAQLRGGVRLTASVYDVLPAVKTRKLNPPGEWNTSRILVSGNHVEHWLNGAKTVEFEMGSETLRTAIAASKFKDNAAFGVKIKSPILLQEHGEELSVRRMKIRVLPAK